MLTAVQSLRLLVRGGLLGGGRVGALRAREGAVMLTAVQSLRLLVRRGGVVLGLRWGGEVGLVGG